MAQAKRSARSKSATQTSVRATRSDQFVVHDSASSDAKTKTAGSVGTSKHGNASASKGRNKTAATRYVSVRVEKSLIDELDIETTSELAGSVENGALIIRPTRRIGKKEADKLATDVMRDYDDALRKLAR
jgi:hypothetical protein